MCQILLIYSYTFSLNAYINSERQVLEKTDKIVYTVFLRTFVSGTLLCNSFTLLSFNSMKWIHFQMKKQQFTVTCVNSHGYQKVKGGFKPRLSDIRTFTVNLYATFIPFYG